MAGTKSRVIENPVNGEIVTFLNTTEETNGEFLRVQLELKPNGKVPAHFHTDFTEKFEMLEGELNLKIGKKLLILLPGDEITVYPKQVHRFWNTSGKNVKFINEFRPALNLEKAVRIGDGLAADGMANKQGIPKNIFHLALVVMWLGAFFPGVPAWLQKAFFGTLANMARKRGIEKVLTDKYL